jgi:hypothetical protein
MIVMEEILPKKQSPFLRGPEVHCFEILFGLKKNGVTTYLM